MKSPVEKIFQLRQVSQRISATFSTFFANSTLQKQLPRINVKSLFSFFVENSDEKFPEINNIKSLKTRNEKDKDAMTRDDIIQILERNKEFLQREFGVIRVGIFGSVSRDEFNNESDIDLIVEMTNISYDKYAGLCLFLEKLFNRKIQVLLKSKYMSKEFFERIREEIIYV